MKWTEGKVGRVLARNTFMDDLCVLPNCTWTGDEVDLLVVTKDLRIIDVEIKISRADLKADKEKGKWWRQDWGDWVEGKYVKPPPVPKAWPSRVWKHYYAMPEAIWTEGLLDHVQPVSGVLLISGGEIGEERVRCVKHAKPCRTAERLTEGQVIQIARLASIRMWGAYQDVEKMASKVRGIEA